MVAAGILVLQEAAHWLLAGVVVGVRAVAAGGSALEAQVPRRDQDSATVRLFDLMVLI